jgi:hypothetical protein
MKKHGVEERKKRHEECRIIRRQFERWLETLDKKPTRLWEVEMAFGEGWILGRDYGALHGDFGEDI